MWDRRPKSTFNGEASGLFKAVNDGKAIINLQVLKKTALDAAEPPPPGLRPDDLVSHLTQAPWAALLGR